MTEQQPNSEKPTSGGDAASSGGDAASSGGSGARIDPMKVMADALQSIVKRADAAAGITPESPDKVAATPDAKPGAKPKRKRKRKPKSGAADAATTPEGQPQQGPRQPGKRRKKKRGDSPMAHANDAVRSLSAMLRNVLDSQKVHFLSRPRFMELEMRVPLDARMDGSRCASKLVDAVLKLVAEVRENDNALAPGSVYCFFHESADAEGCRPDEPRHVFDGYGSTGRPKFTDFVTMAIERKSAGIDKLLAGEDVTLTHVSAGRVLRTAQLAEFGKTSPVFRILGQVDAGLFAVRGQDAKAAFSFQVLLGKDLQGQPVFRLHPVGQCDVMNLVDHSVAQILQRFQGDLDEAALRLRGQRKNGVAPDEEEFVLPMLQDLAKRLEDRARHRIRRTEHAERRAEKSNRPTTKAYDEASAVGDDGILWDDKENTIVVLGGHGRVHIFTPEARHVTSVNMNRASVQQRLKSHRWRETEPGERGGFRMQLRQLVKTQREEGESKSSAQKAEKSDSRELQSKIAGLMSGLGGGAAKPPAEEPKAVPTESPGTPVAASTPADAAPTGTPPVESPPAESEPVAPETVAPETAAPEPAEPPTTIPTPEDSAATGDTTAPDPEKSDPT